MKAYIAVNKTLGSDSPNNNVLYAYRDSLLCLACNRLENSVFYEVEIESVSDRESVINLKSSGIEFKLIREFSVSEMAKISGSMKDAHSASSGFGVLSITGDDHAMSSTSGNSANSITLGGYAHSATSGDYADSYTSGFKANSTVCGSRSCASTIGCNSNAVACGDLSCASVAGEHSIAAAIGWKGRAMGSLGDLLILVQYDENHNPVKCVSRIVDGNYILPNVWYGLDENGVFKSLI